MRLSWFLLLSALVILAMMVFTVQARDSDDDGIDDSIDLDDDNDGIPDVDDPDDDNDGIPDIRE